MKKNIFNGLKNPVFSSKHKLHHTILKGVQKKKIKKKFMQHLKLEELSLNVFLSSAMTKNYLPNVLNIEVS